MFYFCNVHSTKIFDLAYRPIDTSKFNSVFVSFIFHPCMRLMTNKLQPLPLKFPKKFIEGCGDCSIILVPHGTFVSHGCLFKIHLIIPWINWAVFQTELKLNLIQDYIFYKSRKFNELQLKFVDVIFVSLLSRLVYTMTRIPQSFSVVFF